MSNFQRLGLALSLLVVFAFSTRSAHARQEEWTDVQGAKFRGEPVELLEPFALFRSNNSCRTVPVNLLTPADCVKFYEAVGTRKPRAETWATATGKLTGEIAGGLKIKGGNRFTSLDFKTKPEPEFLIVLFVDKNEQRERDMVEAAIAADRELSAKFGGMAETVFYGLNQSPGDELAMAEYMNVPFAVADFDEPRSMETLVRHLPRQDFGMVVFSRDGDPLFLESMPRTDEVQKLYGKVEGILGLTRPENPKSWEARAYFWGAVQQNRFASSQSGPLLIGNPLMPAGLIQRKVFNLDADLHVSPTGTVTSVDVKPSPDLPEKMAKPLADGLKHAVLVPAVDKGNFVEGTYAYHFSAPH